MKTMNRFGAVLAASAVLALAGCGTMSDPFGPGAAPTGQIAAGNAYAGVGTVQSINLTRQNPELYRFTIRMNDGGIQTITNPSSSGFAVGERVRIANGSLMRN